MTSHKEKLRIIRYRKTRCKTRLAKVKKGLCKERLIDQTWHENALKKRIEDLEAQESALLG